MKKILFSLLSIVSMECLATSLMVPMHEDLGSLPVIVAARNGDWNKVDSLIQKLKGASFKIAIDSALFYAVDMGNLEGVKLLAKYGADLDKKVEVQDCQACNGFYQFAKMRLIGYAAVKKHWDIVKCLIERGVTIEESNIANDFASVSYMLEQTASDGNVTMFQYFLQNYTLSDLAKIDTLYYLLEWLDNDTDLECIKALISVRTPVNLSDLNDEDRKQFSDDTLEPLVYAAFSKNIAKVELLLSAGANLKQAIETAEVINDEYQDEELEEAITFLKSFVK